MSYWKGLENYCVCEPGMDMVKSKIEQWRRSSFPLVHAIVRWVFLDELKNKNDCQIVVKINYYGILYQIRLWHSRANSSIKRNNLMQAKLDRNYTTLTTYSITWRHFYLILSTEAQPYWCDNRLSFTTLIITATFFFHLPTNHCKYNSMLPWSYDSLN